MRGIGFATILLAMALLAGNAIAAGGGGTGGEHRIALVIGNSAYRSSPLVNPANDARLMATALRDNGFDVIEKLDVTQIEMKLAITTFGEKLDAAQGNAVGLFYYAGHGVQVGGVNYLIPIDAPIEKESHVSIYAVSANDVLATVEYARNALNIVVLDACRNNPFARSFRSSVRGLAQMNAVTGTLIAYSTAPGQVALDGDGRNSPYTAALATAIREPGVPVERVFKNVRDAVLESTQGRQTPWEASSLTGPDFYIVPPARDTAVTTPPPQIVVTPPVDPGISASERAALERTFWESIQDSDDATLFQAYIDQYPNGVFVVIAKRRLEALAGTDVAMVPPVIPPDRTPGYEVESLDS
ncbi:MAG: caspase domain-containing protein, partial [Alphaproteobacteria bacterium]|nr:caspase domain-containing protein [Alphaproteobacteria bacterium]